LQCIYQLVLAGELSVSNELCATLDKAHLALLDMVDAVAAGQNLAGAPAEIEAELAVYTNASNTNEAAETEIEFSLPQSEAWQGYATSDENPNVERPETSSEEIDVTALSIVDEEVEAVELTLPEAEEWQSTEASDDAEENSASSIAENVTEETDYVFTNSEDDSANEVSAIEQVVEENSDINLQEPVLVSQPASFADENN